MREIGQLSPIWVRKIKKKAAETGETLVVPKLIAGAHRIEAKKMLGEKMIDAVYFDVDKQGALLLEISENLDRGELTVLERAEHIDMKVQLIRARRKAAHTAIPGGRQPGDKAISAAARELGHSRDLISRSSRIAGMSDAAKAKAAELELDDNESALLKIAKKKKPNEQVAMAEQLAAKKKGAKKGSKKPAKFSKKDGASSRSWRMLRRMQLSSTRHFARPLKMRAASLSARFRESRPGWQRAGCGGRGRGRRRARREKARKTSKTSRRARRARRARRGGLIAAARCRPCGARASVRAREDRGIAPGLSWRRAAVTLISETGHSRRLAPPYTTTSC